MGASIAVAARSTRLALIGDYALLHSGLNALIDVYEKQLPLLCIVMKNNCTAMTGKQPAYDPVPCLSWANPVICSSDDRKTLEKEWVIGNLPRTVVIEVPVRRGAGMKPLNIEICDVTLRTGNRRQASRSPVRRKWI